MASLPSRIPKAKKRASRWRSQAHCSFVRTFACAMCGSTTNTQPAHYRLGSHTGAGQRPHDWLTTPLCDGPWSNIDGQLGCHQVQHAVGEATFWKRYAAKHGQTVHQLIDALIKASPKRREIEQEMRERGL